MQLSNLDHRHYCFEEYLNTLFHLVERINNAQSCDAEAREILEETIQQLRFRKREIDDLGLANAPSLDQFDDDHQSLLFKYLFGGIPT